MRVGDVIEIRPERLNLEGEGVLAHEGAELRCPGVFPGETAEARVEHSSRQKRAVVLKRRALLEVRPERRAAPCVHHESRPGGGCSGCALLELDEAAQRELKRAMLAQILGRPLAPLVAAPHALGYRFSSKRVAFTQGGQIRLGSYTRGSHEPAAMRTCLVDHALLQGAFAEVEDRAAALGLTAYDARRTSGELRYVWGKTNGAEVLITLIAAAPASPALEQLATELSCAGVFIAIQEGTGNTMRAETPRHVAGKASLALTLLGQPIPLGALDFLQPNPALIERAYEALLDASDLASRALAFDLYAGSGATTFALRRHFTEVLACEANAESASALATRSESVEQFLARWLERGAGRIPDLIVANPPRKGLGAEVCARLLALGSPRVHLMSCGPEGLARDLELLDARYEVDTLTAFDSLPQTPHVEVVARLRRR